jgi:DNA polymerase-3 subunit delta
MRAPEVRCMTPDQALKEAHEGRLRPVYAVVGDDILSRSRVVQALREAALAGGVPGLNEDQMVAGDVSVDTVLSAARTVPMMAKRRFVLVRSLERWEPKDATGGAPRTKTDKDRKAVDALERLAEYAEAPSETTTLVLVAEKLDKRRRLVAIAHKRGFVVACEAPGRAELPAWLERVARERGNKLVPGVSELLTELTGPELGGVIDALERVCLYAGEGANVTEEHVAQCVVQVRAATVWELVGVVGRRDLGAALAALDRVYDPQDRGLRLVGVLAWSARQLIRFEGALAAGAPPAEAARLAGAPPFKARELTDQVKRFGRSDLEGFLETLASVDLALKGGSKRPARAVLEHAIIELCSGSRAGQRGIGRAKTLQQVRSSAAKA